MSSSPYQISRRSLLGAAGAATAFGLLRFAPEASATEGPQNYTASWSSVNQHPPAPEWFQDGKFGIYYHWGVFSVPAFHNEWYPRRMYESGQSDNRHHVEKYGDPSVWPYHNFIDGARDKAGNFVQFAPRLVSQGGAWDPDAWARLFKDAGARFAGPVAEHHDGYSMWNSRCNPWNSVQRGPRLDLVGLGATAIRAQGLKLVTSLHHAYHSTGGFFEFAPRQSDPALRMLYGQLGSTAMYKLWGDKLIEVIDGYQPDMIWQDFGMDGIAESQRLQFLAHYYNAAVAGNKDVVTVYKDGLSIESSVFDIERGGPTGMLSPFWMTDDSVSSTSWCYTEGIGYYSARAMLHGLIDRISKGGATLLNIAPKADGSIPSEQQAILLAIGDWLGRFGECFYATRAWSCHGEGPTQMGGSGLSITPKAGTARDIRFARSKDNRVLYATALGWQGATMTIGTLNSNRINLTNLTGAQLLNNTTGTYINLPAPTQDGAGLHLTMPSSNPPFDALAYSVKLTFSGQVPTLNAPAAPTTWVKIANATTGKVLDGGGQVAAGSLLKQWHSNESPNLQWQLIPVGDGYYRILNRINNMVIGSRGDTTQDAPVSQAPWSGSRNQQWMLNSVGGNRYQIINRANHKAIDGNGSTTSGSNPVMRPPASTVSTSTDRDWIITAV
ncbi:alpha-L-fucosidase [Kitasatospora sp. NPDC059327]|uniref:alpha-L-fucosidase n=1 Tax=Kitasatospora sp. NPDC059327 TaxID=3346803 RepID=UPI0036BB4FE0